MLTQHWPLTIGQGDWETKKEGPEDKIAPERVCLVPAGPQTGHSIPTTTYFQKEHRRQYRHRDDEHDDDDDDDDSSRTSTDDDDNASSVSR
ncbi:hypothetical protein F503_07821 [Ophiostoma piceae UAMH 11346]|uniref:Uncharacterized protein n=1 Tax=Ophiostoma piceae (strain UAMH 11346) TaxID=1262450 RepID=S3D1P8_OPHP1|nr:hypothetical protein F503_07821 [Ophiostoma piceae UAMH 11346]